MIFSEQHHADKFDICLAELLTEYLTMKSLLKLVHSQ